MSNKSSHSQMIDTEQYIANLFRARFPFIYIPSWEENRVVDLITNIAQNANLIKRTREVYTWTSTDGLKEIVEDGERYKNNVNTAVEALDFIESYNEDSILILKDIHNLLNPQRPDYNFVRKIRDIAYSLKNHQASKNVVIITPSLALPEDLQKDITVVDFKLPALDELLKILNNLIVDYEDKIKLSEYEKEIICKAAQGLTLQEAENAFIRAIVSNNKLTIDELDIILDEKCQVIKKTGVLEYVKSDLNIDDVGGLENMKNWLKKRNNSWMGKAQKDYNLPAPKGILITGVPGCGKSLTAKAVSALWNLPLLRLDVGRIFSGIVGSSEENMRKAIKTAEAVAPSILWVDEIEKGFGSSRGELDGGTSSRVFGTFLTWLQEKSEPVFVIATANNIDKIPSEMLRKGRFDEIFFVDLPTHNERKQIFKIHLTKRLQDSISKDFRVTDELLNSLAQSTEGFVGSEIEQVIVSALFEAFSEDRKLREEDLFKVIANTVPLSTTQAEQIMSIRQWANQRAVAATKQSDRNDYIIIEESTNDKNKDKIKRSRGGRFIDF